MADTGFIRFRDVTIPANSRIISATVIFTGFEPGSGIDTNLLCYFEDVDSPAAPTDKTDLDGRALTAAISWDNVEEWLDNYVYQTPQLASILQTVIDRTGWASGNDVLFLAVDNSSTSYRMWSAFEHRGGVEKAALRVSWNPPEQIDTPLIEPVEQFQLVDFECSIRTYPTDASIYYTLDGSDPDEDSTLYSAPFAINSNLTVKAKAYKQYWTPSEIASRAYTVYGIPVHDKDPISGSVDFQLDTSDYPHFIYEGRGPGGFAYGDVGDPGSQAIYYQYMDSDGWSVPELAYDAINSPEGMPTLYESTIVLDGSGNPHLFLPLYGGNINPTLLYHAYKSGGSWTYEQLSHGTYRHEGRVRAFWGSDNQFHVIWGYDDDYYSSSDGIWHSYGNTGSWTHQKIFTPTGVESPSRYIVSIDEDSSGYVYCFYSKYSSIYNDTYLWSGLFYKTNKDGWVEHRINPSDTTFHEWFSLYSDAIVDHNDMPMVLTAGRTYDGDCPIYSENMSLIYYSSGFAKNDWVDRCVSYTTYTNNQPKIRKSRTGSNYYYIYAKMINSSLPSIFDTYLGTVDGVNQDSSETRIGRCLYADAYYASYNALHQLRVGSDDSLHIIRAERIDPAVGENTITYHYDII